MIYTTNATAALDRQLRKAIETKGSSPLRELREARLARTDDRAWADPTGSLGERVHAAFMALVEEDGQPRVLDQATGLALYDPVRYTHLGTDATEQYLPVILELLPTDWSDERRHELSTLILATLRGLLADLLTSGDNSRVTAGLTALERMLDTEERLSRDPCVFERSAIPWRPGQTFRTRTMAFAAPSSVNLSPRASTCAPGSSRLFVRAKRSRGHPRRGRLPARSKSGARAGRTKRCYRCHGRRS